MMTINVWDEKRTWTVTQRKISIEHEKTNEKEKKFPWIEYEKRKAEKKR